MTKALKFSVLIVLLFSISTAGQVPVATHIAILKAEDSLDYNKAIEDLLKSPNEAVKIRAVLAAGRIGDRAATRPLTSLLEKERSAGVRAMAAFALGEIESIEAAAAILAAIGETAKPLMPDGSDAVDRGRLVEAAGKIAAANPDDPKSKELARSIIFTLEAEYLKRERRNRETVLLALTSALRARPEGADASAAKFLADPDARIRADAANTLSRLRAKNANAALRAMLVSDKDPIARANAARALGAAEDKEAPDILIEAATKDADSRVRVSAIRSLAQVNDKKAIEPLLKHGNTLLTAFNKSKKSNFVPTEKSELLELATALGRILENTDDESAINFLTRLRIADEMTSSETETAYARISPKSYLDKAIEFITTYKGDNWRSYSAVFQGLSILVALEPNESNTKIDSQANFLLLKSIEGWIWTDKAKRAKSNFRFAVPSLIRAMAASKKGRFDGILIPVLDSEDDVMIRAASAELLGNHSTSVTSVEALIVAFAKALRIDKNDNDAQLAIMNALYKLDKKASAGSLIRALNFPDLRIRQKAFELLSDPELQKEVPEVKEAVDQARSNMMDKMLPHGAEIFQFSNSETKLGQVLNTEADYRRAVSRRNGAVKAVLTTEKGTFTIDLLPEDAPLTVDNFIKLANAKYFDGLEVHRVVPNFVMQDGDPLGNGSGGPGWSIRCEVNMVPYERGVVGMALSGKHTGGSQWFVTHSPQPHLDGGYTVFGKVNEIDMKVVDNIVRGDKILTVRIVGK